MIESLEETYIDKIHNRYTECMDINKIDMIHHLMERYRKITETDLKYNQNILDKALETTMTINNENDDKLDIVDVNGGHEDCVSYKDHCR